jgi:16S rRNA (guanine966-N2)-methyltransferase
VRIVGGINKGRNLIGLGTGDPSAHLRPTSDRVRESIFNLITGGRFGNKLENGDILDLFAGTGALGLEALSRGAKSVVFVDNGQLAIQLLKKNISICNVESKTKVIKSDATKRLPILSKNNFGMVFIDPPYGKGLGQRALKILLEYELISEETLIILEEGNQINSIENFFIKDCRRYGSSYAHFLTIKKIL